MARKKKGSTDTNSSEEKESKKRVFDLTEHTIVPNHVIISEKEAKEVLDRYKIGSDRLPKILSTDPAVVSIGAKPGQIIRVERESQTAKKAIAYRVVIETTN